MKAVIQKEIESINKKLPSSLSDAVKAEIADSFYSRSINGVSHQMLTERTFNILVDNLTSYGNVLSIEHKQALYELVMNYTKMIQGTTSGRLAFGLDTGMGKTESVVALIKAIHELGLDHVSILVCQSKVEGLCELKRKLIAMGVPEDRIGLIHSYGYDPAKVSNLPEGYASMPSTPKVDHRQFQLVTHNRVKGGGDISKFNTYRDEPRSLAIWDESLLVSDSLSIVERELRKAVHNFATDKEGKADHAGLVKYFNESFAEIQAGFSQDSSVNIRLEALEPETMTLYKKMLGKYFGEFKSVLTQLLDMSSQELKLLTTKDGQGVITYQIAVPKELNKVAILDASWWIRELERLDDSITSNTYFIHPHLKRYDNVTIHQMQFSGSRSNLTADMSGKAEQRKVSKELAAVIKAIPSNEAVLIFTYKRQGNRVDFVKTLKTDLNQLGVDTEATLDITRSNQIETKPRINFLTWGSETSLNEYSCSSNVILAGVLHRSHVDLAAAIAGQSDDLKSDIQYGDIMRVQDSEIAHLTFQALSRGSCRKVNNGYAEPMKVWVIHRGLRLRPLLETVMGGCKWLQWDEVDPVNAGVIDRTAQTIHSYLDGMSDTVSKISTSQLRKILELPDISKTSWTSALNKAMSATKNWCLQGRSVIKVSLHDRLFSA